MKNKTKTTASFKVQGMGWGSLYKGNLMKKENNKKKK